MRSFWTILSLLVVTASTACSSKDGACTDLENTATAVLVTTGDAVVPTGTGGTVSEGLYHLSSVVRTPTSPMPQVTFRQTLRVTGNTIESSADDSDKPAYTSKSTFTTAGPSITFTRVCSTEKNSSGELQYSSYTAAATHISLYNTDLGFSVTFTKNELAP